MAQLKQGFGRTKSVMLRLTPDEHKLVKAASKNSRSMSDYIRGVLMSEISNLQLKACARTKGFVTVAKD